MSNQVGKLEVQPQRGHAMWATAVITVWATSALLLRELMSVSLKCFHQLRSALSIVRLQNKKYSPAVSIVTCQHAWNVLRHIYKVNYLACDFECYKCMLCFHRLFVMWLACLTTIQEGPRFDSRLCPRNFSGSIGSGIDPLPPQPREDNWVAISLRSSEIRLRKITVEG